jgi:CspA family cold shock protein
MTSGKVKWFNSRKGYGFVTPDDSSKDVFIHISALEESGIQYLDEGDVISFDVSDEKGKTKAVNIKKTNA